MARWGDRSHPLSLGCLCGTGWISAVSSLEADRLTLKSQALPFGGCVTSGKRLASLSLECLISKMGIMVASS